MHRCASAWLSLARVAALKACMRTPASPRQYGRGSHLSACMSTDAVHAIRAPNNRSRLLAFYSDNQVRSQRVCIITCGIYMSGNFEFEDVKASAGRGITREAPLPHAQVSSDQGGSPGGFLHASYD